ncbi:cyclase family protein [Alteribacter natronophilus]|uniref:cyclase family protein n=1 Tax=Alteribacter natronophilus TaxID=2583810 RepID=UPI00110D4F51|nr:cyclase family protein [Alteribacter natronophilus]TMW73544.1 arylformamidase [Alteribacter natronophilus]
MKLIDITQPLEEGMNVWPGDTEFTHQPSMQISGGDSVNVAGITMSTHTGTHIDAPFHVDRNGRTIDELPLEYFTGEAIVVDLVGKKAINPEDLDSVDLKGVKKVLFRTAAEESGHSYHGFPEVSPDLAEKLKKAGVHLIGVDFPSVDPLESKELRTHHALNGAGIAILEGLHLYGVKPGFYELTAFPLRLRGGDGSPVRAVLRETIR